MALRGEVRSLQPNGPTLSGQNVDIRCKSLLRRRLARKAEGALALSLRRRLARKAEGLVLSLAEANPPILTVSPMVTYHQPPPNGLLYIVAVRLRLKCQYGAKGAAESS